MNFIIVIERNITNYFMDNFLTVNIKLVKVR